MEGPISFWGYKEQESNLILPEHDDDDDDVLNKIFPLIMLLNNETVLWYFVSRRDVLCTSLHINDFPVFALLATMISFLHDYGTLYSWAKDMLHTPLYLLKIRNHLYQHHSKAVRYYKYSNSFAGAKYSTKSIRCKKMSEEQTFLLPPVTM